MHKNTMKASLIKRIADNYGIVWASKA